MEQAGCSGLLLLSDNAASAYEQTASASSEITESLDCALSTEDVDNAVDNCSSETRHR